MASVFVFVLVVLLPALLISTVGAGDSEALRLVVPRLGGGLSAQLGSSASGGTAHPCRLSGVACERRGGGSGALRAISLSLPFRGLDGSLSPAIGRLSALQEISLPGNHLSGEIPPDIAGCRRLQILNLSGNALSGQVPLEISSLSFLRTLDISDNKLSGSLKFLAGLRNLESLSLGGNLFTGQIPSVLPSMRKLRFLHLAGNPGLRGPLLNLPADKEVSSSGNLLPMRRILAENSTGDDSRDPASVADPSASPPATEKSRRRRPLVIWIVGFVVGGLAGVISGVVFSALFRLLVNCLRGRYHHRGGPSIFSPLIKPEDLDVLSKGDALEGMELIGRGGCGEVYRTTFTDGKIVAVKKIAKMRLDDGTAAPELSEEDSKILDRRMRQIKSEINTVGYVRHRNLLPLLAHVPRSECHLLVYEFMKNGTLDDALKGFAAGHREFDWPARRRVAAGIAAGLEYLHMQHSPRIIHRDLKPANILLDDEMEARIADFGLAKSVADAHTHVTASNVAGTVGFIAPEYHQTLKFTDKCDIYSFGVILGVMVMGRMPSDEFFQSTDELCLVNWLRNAVRDGRGAEAIDERLKGKGYEEEMALVLKVACLCTVNDPRERPNSKDVRCMLAQIALLTLPSPSPSPSPPPPPPPPPPLPSA